MSVRLTLSMRPSTILSQEGRERRCTVDVASLNFIEQFGLIVIARTSIDNVASNHHLLLTSRRRPACDLNLNDPRRVRTTLILISSRPGQQPSMALLILVRRMNTIKVEYACIPLFTLNGSYTGNSTVLTFCTTKRHGGSKGRGKILFMQPPTQPNIWW
jgi:hypothetical protein